ncbi:universal stress protein [Noviherbaspirillum massiliense]|uniref:universal stress protein n=1 Tax=Noviherbaspirillum massiliense TaxID=1465823 RepID=UPI0002DD7E46|nr:universal stress protein [Noviherbaspirillum massiliense]
MSYKTIVVHIDKSRQATQRVETAAMIALHENAHLMGTATTGVSKYFYQTMALAPGDPAIAPHLDMLQQRAKESLVNFKDIVQRIGVPSWEARLVDDEPASGLSLQARYADLTVLGQYDPEEASAVMDSDLPEFVAMNSGCPVLVYPYVGASTPVGERVLLAWNASAQAMRAVRGALPLLRQAKSVEVALFMSNANPDAYGDTPGDDIALYLARHGIKANVQRQIIPREKPDDIGGDLLSLAADLNSDLLVMGCYGHSRFREILLGGATRTVLSSMTIPALMAH